MQLLNFRDNNGQVHWVVFEGEFGINEIADFELKQAIDNGWYINIVVDNITFGELESLRTFLNRYFGE